jgi:hypothetical protein
MNRILLGAVALLLFAITPLFAQTNEPPEPSGPRIWSPEKQAWVPWDSTKQRSEPPVPESLTPDQYGWTVSAGMAYVYNTYDLPEAGGGKSSGSGYGGYLATDYFATKALAIRTELMVFSRSDTAEGITVSITEVALDIGVKFYPLQLTKASDFRLQPYLRAAIGPVFYDVSATGASVSADPTLFGAAGAGLDIVLGHSWSITVEADYYTTILDSTVSVGDASANFRQYGLLGEAGVRYRF